MYGYHSEGRGVKSSLRCATTHSVIRFKLLATLIPIRHLQLRSMIIGLLVVTCISPLTTMSYTLHPRRRMHQRPKTVIKPVTEPNEKDNSYIPHVSQVLSRVDKRLHQNRTVRSNKNLERTSTFDLFDLTLFNKPTSTRRVYLYSKSGQYLQMSNNGHINGSSIPKRNAEFLLETIKPEAVRLKSVATGRYICFTKRQMIVAKRNLGSCDRNRKKRCYERCLLRYYEEENNYELFASYRYTQKGTESGWLLALKKNGKLKPPKNTKVGDKSTMFNVHSVDGT